MGSTFHGMYACSGQKAISRNGVSSHHVGSREHTQVPRLDGQCILPPLFPFAFKVTMLLRLTLNSG